MKTKFIEATQKLNWGKFMVCQFDQAEWARRSEVDGSGLLAGRGWDACHFWVVDIATGEGAIFRHGGNASHDLNKHKIWVCPLFEPFLNWLYRQNLTDLDALPAMVEFTPEEAPFETSGYRRPGPDRAT